MTKIVINKCFGGFSLSDEAFARYLDIKGIEYETQPSQWTWLKDGKDYYASGHLGDDAYYLSDRGIDRTDPALIQVVEELGAEANGQCADLGIVEIPDDVDWEIAEYDGTEWVAEKHRTWR